MISQKRPFTEFARGASIFIGMIAFASLFTGTPFLTGVLLAFLWAFIAYGSKYDIPDTTQQERAGKALLGFFLIIVGVILAGVSPNYLSTQSKTTEWLVMWGLFLGTQIGLSLLLTTPLKSFSYWCGYIAAAIILHSAILRFPQEFTDISSARTLVLVSLMLSFWFLGIWLFFDISPSNILEETKKAKQTKSFIGILSGLLTVMEFINILYTIFGF